MVVFIDKKKVVEVIFVCFFETKEVREPIISRMGIDIGVVHFFFFFAFFAFFAFFFFCFEITPHFQRI